MGNDMANNDSGHRNEDLSISNLKRICHKTETVEVNTTLSSSLFCQSQKGKNNGMREVLTWLFSFSNLTQNIVTLLIQIPFVYKF